jgi:predicted outer membrane repeat protein
MKILAIVGVFLCYTGVFAGETRTLDPNMDIQTAIGTSRNGDTLILRPGVYVVRQAIVFMGKGITLTSQEPNDPAMVAATVITSQGDSSGSRIFEFTQEEDPNTVIRGLTIQGGKAPLELIDANEPELAAGGAVLCYHASPTIRQCVFEDNKAEKGGAIYAVSSHLVVEACSFTGNSADGLFDSAGGAIYLNRSPALILNCLFENNTTSPVVPDDPAQAGTGGGAICCTAGSDASISDCTLKTNRSADDGGAICCHGSSPVVAGCDISQNYAGDAGGGVYCSYGSEPTIEHCILAGNAAYTYGGGLFHRDADGLSVVNCTFVGNRAPIGGGVRISLNSHGGLLINSILWANEASNGPSIAVYPNSSPVVAYCDVAGGFAGDNVLNVDPLFALSGYWDPNGTPQDPSDDVWIDGDYHLQSATGRWDPVAQSWVADEQTSLCIDQGDPKSAWEAETWPHGGRINLGAFGGTWQASHSLDLSGRTRAE